MRRWIDGVTPPPVMALEPWIRNGQEMPDPEGMPGREEELPRALAADARAALDRALERPGRVRDSAFHLLAADALLTYACEAALDAADPQEPLRCILTSILAT